MNDMNTAMNNLACRAGCGACCIAPSISSAIPGMPMGKPAGVRCIQLDEDNRCKIFASPDRPTVCASLQASSEMCGDTREDAMVYLIRLDRLTSA
jgi:Fe-S-cluster containining protein